MKNCWMTGQFDLSKKKHFSCVWRELGEEILRETACGKC